MSDENAPLMANENSPVFELTGAPGHALERRSNQLITEILAVGRTEEPVRPLYASGIALGWSRGFG